MVLVIVFLVFGVGRLPQIGEAIGKMRRNYKKALDDDSVDVTPKVIEEPAQKKVSSGRPTAPLDSAVDEAELVD